MGRFLLEAWPRVLLISAVLLAPCFWHRHLEAGDLASHTYNAWLAQLTERGQAPGLWLARQSNNILFDQSLSALAGLAGLRAAEKILVAACVLLFFWSIFAFVSAISGRAPWFLAPGLAMLSYGWVFQQGFMNFYLSVALAFAGLALVAGGRGGARWLAFALLPLIWLAHPLGALFFVACFTYLLIVPSLETWQQLCLTGIAALLPVGLIVYLSNHYPVQGGVPLSLRWLFNGSDQLWLYGVRYHWLADTFFLFAVVCLLVDVAARRGVRASADGRAGLWPRLALPLQLYLLALWCVFVLPNGVFLPQYSNPITLLTSRATVVCAVFLFGLLGGMRPRKWHLVFFGALAAVFFCFLYQDTAKVDRMEAQAERYVRTLPRGERILTTIWPFPGSRILIHHIVDRSCIEQCFSYGNYEPASGQFRVRASSGNGMALADARLVALAEIGNYLVQPGDLPAHEIYQCDAKLTDLCMRELKAGDVTGSAGPHPYAQ